MFFLCKKRLYVYFFKKELRFYTLFFEAFALFFIFAL